MSAEIIISVVVLLAFEIAIICLLWRYGTSAGIKERDEILDRLNACEIDVANLKVEVRGIRHKLNGLWADVTRTLIDWYTLMIERMLK